MAIKQLQVNQKRASKGLSVPGPRGHFLLGSILDFKRDILKAMAQGQQNYGDLVRYHLGPVSVYGVSHPDLAEAIFIQGKDIFGKLGPDNPLRLVLGEGLLTSADNTSWLSHRRMMQPIFHRQSIATLYDKMTACVQSMMTRWEERYPPGTTIDLHQELMRVTLDIVSQTMFSANVMEDLDVIGPDAVNLTIDYAFQRLQNPFSPPVSWPTPANRRFKRVMRALDDLLFRLIDGRRHAGEYQGDLLDMLLAAHDEETGTTMSNKELRDEVITILAAGHETTAITLTWAWYLISQNPDCLHKIQQEVDQVLAGRMPTLADLPKLPYSLQAFEEAMRLYPSAPIIPRLTTASTQLGGHELPAGARVLVNLFNIHRHPDFWPDPERYDPTRFAPEKKKAQHRFAYLPFGAGPHLCIGNHFALMEAHLLMTVIAQRYRLRHVPEHPVVNHATITLRPKYGMLMTLEPRNPAVQQSSL